jgi:ribA/ribD-fused uncharacterized protein
MKYTIKSIQNTGKPVKYLLFWGHQKSRDGSVTKSCFSQWWESEFIDEGINYKTAEHFMMAEKAKLFDNVEVYQKIIECKSPAAAKKLGRQVKGFSQEIWRKHRFEIVKKANHLKFSQNPELKDFLLKTKKRVLVEASPVDKIWGIGLASDHNDAQNPKKWKGENLLGFALMEVRDQLQ